MKLSEVEGMRKQQLKKRNLSLLSFELVVYVLFIFLVMVLCYGNRKSYQYYMTKSMRDGLISLHSTQTAAKQFYMICVLLFIIFVLLYLGREGYKLYKRGFRYFKSFWNWLELCQVFFSALAIIMSVVQSEKVSLAIRKVQTHVYGNVSFQEALV